MSLRLSLALLALVVLSACGSGSALSQAVIDQATRQGVAPDLMYVVDLPGYELAEQSVGAVNEEGFGAFYTASDGRQVEMRVDRGPYTCAGTCERDGDGWYTEHEGRQEYVAVRADHYVRLICPDGQVDRAVLKQAAEGARPVVGDGTPAPAPSRVERGDLPENGDGAPIQPTGPGS
ncbi:hypothetical protein LDL08_08920 [Nonomuraea glycinis]|uniref:hypothetical protein n=1 Tax=Nonomuraea glycinis TaxID=2047744 RepID=UPI00166B80D6|nr:hypothetical protein [Nonomuraea glycinis]MCA2176303.1 hypothetical protein [Nonomuraea glycinis]